MSQRPHIYTIVRTPAESAPSPNAQIPEITAEIRVYWPAGMAHEKRAQQILELAFLDATKKIMAATA